MKNATRGTNEWEKCVEDVKNMFSFFKASWADSYRKMSSAVTGEKKAYYDYV